MTKRSIPTSIGLLAAASACSGILGLETDSRLVACNDKTPCPAGQTCTSNRCVASTGGAVQTGEAASTGTDVNGDTKSSIGAPEGGTASVMVERATDVGGGPGATSIAPATSAGTLTGGASGTVFSASGGSNGFGGTTGNAGGETSVTFGGTTNGGTAADSGGVSVVEQGGRTEGGGGSVGGSPSSGGAGGTRNCTGTSIDGGIGECVPGMHRCHVPENAAGSPVYWQTCGANCTWDSGTYCNEYCTIAKGCAIAPSCKNMNLTQENGNLCASVPIEGGRFNRSTTVAAGAEYCTVNDPCSAIVGPYSLDVYEVTIGRFRNFVEHYTQNMTAFGTGKNPKIPTDTGWDNSWNEIMPVDRATLVRDLESCSQSTYTDEPAGREFLPIGCVNWYLAFAFCIWDGGRLPTELEWDYAASGGEGRMYPWSFPPENPYVSTEYAVYTPISQFVTLTAPDNVASRRNGIARWGQYDMAGNIAEWVVDAHDDEYVAANPCIDCANLDWRNLLREARGGAYPDDETGIVSSSRMSAVASKPVDWQGFRCARDL